MIEAEWWEYDSLDELADAIAGDIGFIIESAVDARDASLIAVPGGKTGPAIFPKLVAQQLKWKRVTIIPTDERVVPVDSDQSNIREIARAFLPTGARVFPIVSNAAEDYRLAGNAADARLQDLPWPPTSCGSAWAKTDIRHPSLPAPTCRARSTHQRRGGPSE